MLMLSPMTSRSHYVALLVPYTVLMWAWMRDTTTRAVGTAVLAASFILATATSNDLAGQALTEWAYRHSFLVLGALVLLIYIAVIVWKAHKARQSPPLGIGNGIWRIPRF
jgi:predicted MFS family arabinose efflux permease